MRFLSFLICMIVFFLQDINAAIVHKDFVVFTPPKTGTHLLTNVLELMLSESPMITDQLGSTDDMLKLVAEAKANRKYLVSHSFTELMLEELTARGYLVLFTLRDPRDQLISMLYWMKKGYWQEYPVALLTDKEEQIHELITGERFRQPCYETFIAGRLALLQALDPKNILITRFETLVGSKGGGDDMLQKNEIEKIASFLGVTLSSHQVDYIASHCFGSSWSFRNGQIGAWVTEFSPYHEVIYRHLYADKLIELGYK